MLAEQTLREQPLQPSHQQDFLVLVGAAKVLLLDSVVQVVDSIAVKPFEVGQSAVAMGVARAASYRRSIVGSKVGKQTHRT